MNKQEIKNILMSLRTPENDALVNNLLGKIDIMDDISIQKAAQELGNDENKIRNFLEQKLSQKVENLSQKHIPINNMFTYGISGNCIHFHLPGDLHKLLSEKRTFWYNGYCKFAIIRRYRQNNLFKKFWIS